ncbi:MAG: SUF system NifU family Fe-S cluster assembly protein [Acidobacteriota bacterium]|jgi:nitrogen fixation NifU-like protein|nr:MAG: SUF system NifU family Fe-S cluster assembly protein [Acidobacteriota bacterium]
MSDLSELYQDLILDHNRRPRNFGELPDATCHADGHNPLCGDRVVVAARIEDGIIRDIRFTGSGCAISKASASLMTEAVRERRVAEALELFDRFQAMLTTPTGQPVDAEAFGKLAVFAGVREFPMRVKCATLAWHTLKAALLQPGGVVRTE